jgi:peroxiredoxin
MPLMKNLTTKNPAARKPLLLILAILLAGTLLAAWLLRAPMAPQVSGQTITGQAVSSQSLQGKPYLVNFWATSCVTCVKEMPDIVAVHQAFADKGYQTIAVAMSYDRPDYIASFVQDRNLPFMVVHDKDNQWAQAFGDVSVTPTTFVVDGKGRIIKRYVGEPDFADLKRIIARELG